MRKLRDSLNRAQEESKRERDKIVEERTTAVADCSMLRDEKLTLENQVIMKEAALQKITKEVDNLRKQLAATQQRFDQFKTSITVSPRPPEAEKRSDTVVATIDSTGDMASLPSRESLQACIQKCLEHAVRLIQGLKAWHENHFHRFNLSYGPLRSSSELLGAVRKCSSSAGALEENLQFVEEKLKEPNSKISGERYLSLRATLDAYLDDLIRSLPMICNRIDDESAVSFCPPTLVKRNKEIVHSLKEFATLVSQFRQHFVQRKETCLGEEADDNVSIPQACSSLQQSGKELARLFNCKVSLEQQTSELSADVKSSNEALVHGLLVAKSSLEKLSGVMSENDTVFSNSGLHLLRDVLVESGTGTSPKTIVSNGLTNDDSALSSTSLRSSQCESTLASDEETKRLRREVAQLQETIRELEQARDRIGLEAQLEKMRREKEGQKRTELEKELMSLRSFPSSTGFDDAVGGSSSAGLETSDLGGSAESTLVAGDGEGGEREILIVQYYQDIVGAQHQQLYQLTGIAENLSAECENLRAQWALSHRRNLELESEIDGLKAQSKEVTEVLESTRRNYETQLDTLTEHIADMNDKLVERQENILDLKRQLENKGMSKRK